MTSSSVTSALAAVTLALVFAGTARAASTAAPVAAAAIPSAAPEASMTRDELRAHRRQQLARLQAYADAGVFPRNYPDVNHVHMFKDPDGRYCAVANLIHQDGRDDVVDRIAFEDNGFTIATEDDTEVDAWIRTSGLTRAEVTRIQRPAPTVFRARPALQAVAALEPIAPAPAPFAPVPAPDAPVSEAEMTRALQTQLAAIETELRAHEDASLDEAVAASQEAPL